ncbi:MAG TPA: hypothetical protein DCR35_07495 [Runella sp.]|nr:hypothetical protein [Runella sp.]HAO49146.1 hypothetical protein [Runella sp.]
MNIYFEISGQSSAKNQSPKSPDMRHFFRRFHGTKLANAPQSVVKSIVRLYLSFFGVANYGGS